ncbi:MAG: protein kinase [Ktedonobacteraceae bacterium]|nr:protein kinase [Chloroflexota bacterium]
MKGIEGLTLGRYELRRRVAQGGMAEVYLAYDRRVRRQVAIKVLYGRDESFVRRFEREALAVGALSHDHILPLYDFGEQSPWYYLVMPYVEGGTLRDYLYKRKRLTLEEAASFLDQIASALQHAHDHGVVHRDVKPSNILLRPDGYAYLADFGLAKAIMGAEALTSDGTIVGTPEYMAPEQSNGLNDYRSDIYSLGVILYQMLTGRVPFTAESPVAIFLRHIQTKPPSPREINDQIPLSIEGVILKALAKDPNDRYQEAQELSVAYWKTLQYEQLRSDKVEVAITPLRVESEDNLFDETVLTDTDREEEIPLSAINTRVLPDTERAMVRPPLTPLLFPLIAEAGGETSEETVSDAERAYITEHSPAPAPLGLGQHFHARQLLLTCLALLILLLPMGLLWHSQQTHLLPARQHSPTQSTQQLAPSQTAAAQAQAQATIAAQARAQATAGITSRVGAGNVLYSNDMKGPGGGWVNDGTQCYFTPQGYHVRTYGGHEVAWCYSSLQQFSNAVITVRAQLLRGDFYGLAFRLNADEPGFYVLEINNTGEYRFVLATGRSPQKWLTLIDWTRSNAIASGYGSSNTILVLAKGPNFRFYINQQLIKASFTDSTYVSGLIGFLVGGDTRAGTEAAFNNLWVFQK